MDTLFYIESSLSPPVSTERRCRLIVADDHKVFRECLTRLLRESPDLDVVGNAENGLEAVELAALLQPDVAIIDVDMPQMGGIEATRVIVEKHPGVRVIGMSMHDYDVTGARMLAAGAIFYFTKHDRLDALLSMIRNALKI